MDYAELGKGTQQLQNAAKFTHHPIQSQSIQLVCLFGFHREAVTLATETLMGWQA
jgi:hypothetical protein